MRYLLLGPLEFRHDGQPVRLGGAGQRKLLAALLLEANRIVPVMRLVEVVWDDCPPANAVKQAQNRVSAARSAFRHAGLPDPITTTGAGYRLTLQADDLDVLLFCGYLDRARQQARSGHAHQALQQLRDALSLWRGQALAGLDCPALAGATAYLDEQRAAAIEQLAELELGLGHHRQLAGELTAVTAEYPLRERLVGYLMLALYRCDRRADALAAYRRLRARLRDELGVEPMQYVRQLHEQILRADRALLPPRPAGLTSAMGDPVFERTAIPRQLAGAGYPCAVPESRMVP